jgi:uncharacterized protein YkwD
VARVRPTLAAALAVLAGAVAPTLTPAPSAAASAGPCPDATLMPRQGDLNRVRAAVECLVNQVRERHGEAPLRENARIEAAAQRHTEDMAFGDYFDHVGPRGDTPLDRLRASGYVYSRHIGFEVGENIAWGTLSLATPAAIVEAWVHSPEHLANILDGHYRDTAIGVSPHPPASFAHGQAGAIYTQDFGVIVTGGAARYKGAARYNLRPLKSKRRSKGHGSTRRKVGNSHRLGKRHRPRHGRAVRRAGRKRPHQRPRRRHS